MRNRARTDFKALRVVMVGMLTAAIVSAPAVTPTAFASRLGTDVVGSTSLQSGKVASAAAPDIDAKAGILVTGEGNVLWSRRSTTRVPMASTTKLMTALLTLDQGDLDETVVISRAASRVEYGVGLRVGERQTKRTLLQMALVASSNDAAYALAEAGGPGVQAFVKKMNARAKQLGMNDTHYMNPHGLDEPQHYSSAADLALLLRTDMRFAELRRTVSLRSAVWPGVGSLSTTDKLLGGYPGLLGGKTGTTDDAGACFTAMAERGGVTLVSVVLNTPDDKRFDQTRRLFDWGYRHTRLRDVATDGQDTGSARITNGDGTASVRIRTGHGISAAVLDIGAPISMETSLTGPVRLPVFAGEQLGTVTVRQGSSVLATLPAVAASAVGSVQETVGAVPVSDYVDRVVVARSGAAGRVPAFDTDAPVTRKVALQPRVSAPVAVGQRIGSIVYSQGTRIVLEVPVVAGSEVPKPGFLDTVGIAVTRGWLSIIGQPTMAPAQVGR